MVLLFFPQPGTTGALRLGNSQALHSQSYIQVRMGIHSGPVNHVVDVNDQTNIAGAAINVGQRVMDCGDAGHILLSKRVADDLTHYRHWQPYLHDLGECDVKHGLRLHVFNLYRDGLGNPAVPEKLKRGRRWKKAGVSIQPISAARWRKFVLIAALLLSAVALAISFSILSRRGTVVQTTSPVTFVPETSIAVLPFAHLSADKENAYFTEGVG